MRIVLNGQQAFGKSVLEALLDRGEDVVAVYGPPDKPGAPDDPVVAAAREHGLPLVQPTSFKKPEVWEEFRELKPDLCMMAYVTKIVPEEFLNIPTHGTFQYHPSLLPRHRGPSSINWPIIQGESKTGLSIFWPDNGLDTGPILLQQEVQIGPDDSLGTVYFERLFPMGVSAMLESLDLVKAGKAPRMAQDEGKATYEGWCREADVGIDWAKPAAAVHNLIRGADPQPGAWTEHEGTRLHLYDARRDDDTSGEPGAVLDVSEAGLRIAAGKGAVLVRRVRPADGKKQPAAEYSQGRLMPGTRLGTG